MTVILYQPEIPQNTGNIIRTLAATNQDLKIVEPASFSLSERRLKRSALDYFEKVQIEMISDLKDFLNNVKRPFYFFSKSAKTPYTKIPFHKDDIYIFGNETSGLPKYVFDTWPNYFYMIPQSNKVRSLNLANSVAIVLYRALEHFNFSGLDINLKELDLSIL